MYLDINIECASREFLYNLQGRKLQKTVEKCYKSIAFYKKKFDELGILPSAIKSIDDITRLPFTTKNNLRELYPFGLLGKPVTDLVRVQATSGTTGKPVIAGYTAKDVEIWANCVARAIVAAGGTSTDKIQVAYGYGLFTGGLGLHYGAERIGSTVIPASAGNTRRQIMLIQDLESDVLCCTPSYALLIGETMRNMGIDPKTLKLRAGIFGAEPWSENMRAKIEEMLCINAYDIYGLCESMGPGVSYECCAKSGMHINEDIFYPEIINPETGAVLPDGEYGELVISNIGREAMPLLRYRTRDICKITREKCSCGRTLVRMSKTNGRTDDMITVRGVNVFPSQIENLLIALGIEPNYMITVSRKGSLDVMEVEVEVDEKFYSSMKGNDNFGLVEFEKKLSNELKFNLFISARVKIVEPGSLPRFEGKSKRVVDKREL